MKKFILLLLLLPAVGFCDDEEYRQFQQGIDSAQEKIDYSERLISHDSLHELIKKKAKQGQKEKSLVDRARIEKNKIKDPDQPEEKPIPADLPNDQKGKPDASEPADPAHKSSGQAAEPVPVPSPKPASEPKQKKPTSAKTKPTSNSGVYISPALRNLGNTFNDDGARISNKASVQSPEEQHITYGVTIGTSIPVELDNSATNVQPGYVQFVTTEDLIGYKKTLPKHTRLFGQPSAVIGSDKLFVSISVGIDPDTNVEFTLSGAVFDNEGDPGLIAYIVNDGRSMARATDAGVNALGAGIVDLIPGNVATDAAKASADSLLKEKQNNDSHKNGSPSYIVQANPQKASIQVERTF